MVVDVVVAAPADEHEVEKIAGWTGQRTATAVEYTYPRCAAAGI